METPVIAPQVGFVSSCISLFTGTAPDFVDITDEVQQRISTSGITYGMAVIASQHTTAAIVVNEHEPELLKDLSQMLSEIAPEEDVYAHNSVPCGPQETANGHAHCRALLLPTSASIPIAHRSAVLGRYQRIFLVELDCPRPRQVMVALLGS